jgi:hypothetical protein
VVHLDPIYQLQQLRGQRDAVALQPCWQALAVPLREGVSKRATDVRVESYPRRDLGGDVGVGGHRGGELPAARDDQTGCDPGPLGWPATGPGAADEVAQLGQRRRADLVEAGAEGDLVAEQLHEGTGLRGADHSDEGHPVHSRAVVLVQAEALGEADAEQARPQGVLHRLAEAQVRAQRERPHELGQPHARRGIAGIKTLLHDADASPLRPVHVAPREARSVWQDRRTYGPR